MTDAMVEASVQSTSVLHVRRPCGTLCRCDAWDPALQRRAIFGDPSGIGDSSSRGKDEKWHTNSVVEMRLDSARDHIFLLRIVLKKN